MDCANYRGIKLIAHTMKIYERCLDMRLRDVVEIASDQFVPCVGNSTKALSHVSIQPMKRDFTQLLKGNFGGGGMERLNKKLSHQKKGKERMKQIGNVQIPKEAFLNVLRN
ncbi:hypothetical protein Y032_0018g3638 [Ancylostoma ceylanicum]|uniref:GTP-binding protein LepA C-terminal domain-containing protein n=1 Tax=Ancylostoma ceylanicum TaxID=53326 RepID=A0A016V5H3_9BILA|nr:hypothetical protein Y032_0018g3638 [Ancylostoma ceylanicum]